MKDFFQIATLLVIGFLAVTNSNSDGGAVQADPVVVPSSCSCENCECQSELLTKIEELEARIHEFETSTVGVAPEIPAVEIDVADQIYRDVQEYHSKGGQRAYVQPATKAMYVLHVTRDHASYSPEELERFDIPTLELIHGMVGHPRYATQQVQKRTYTSGNCANGQCRQPSRGLFRIFK